jgi:hypothetical protein
MASQADFKDRQFLAVIGDEVSFAQALPQCPWGEPGILT